MSDRLEPVRLAYADPPYLGCAKLYPEHPQAFIWDDAASHPAPACSAGCSHRGGWHDA